MSQRSKCVNESIEISIGLNIEIDCFSNHNGFTDIQVKNAVEEFKEGIKNELTNKLTNYYQSEEFLKSVDFVSYEVLSINTLEK